MCIEDQTKPELIILQFNVFRGHGLASSRILIAELDLRFSDEPWKITQNSDICSGVPEPRVSESPHVPSPTYLRLGRSLSAYDVFEIEATSSARACLCVRACVRACVCERMCTRAASSALEQLLIYRHIVNVCVLNLMCM
jgi:hypothetical protein